MARFTLRDGFYYSVHFVQQGEGPALERHVRATLPVLAQRGGDRAPYPSRQCLDRRIPDAPTLDRKVQAWTTTRNREASKGEAATKTPGLLWLDVLAGEKKGRYECISTMGNCFLCTGDLSAVDRGHEEYPGDGWVEADRYCWLTAQSQPAREAM